MTKENILKDIQSLIEDIDKCTYAILKARWETYDKDQEGRAISRMESLMITAHQELTFLYDYIKEGGKDV